MNRPRQIKVLSPDQRREIFAALVEAQDQGLSVPDSLELIADRYHLSEDKVRQIEQEGVDNDWPPL